eukprot:TRINITY_DN16979_c0_g1_i1.p1 TRINITY_DN16979_c0_g1~~TRINITY_DN16979_c0_g1_i1.p1  ORF type:complete len:732 (+),score=88.99 TRINITY_DN16979_c0_g1_i1:41-2197(+)
MKRVFKDLTENDIKTLLNMDFESELQECKGLMDRDIEQYTRQVEAELSDKEDSLIDQTIKEEEQFIELYKGINDCDKVLNLMEADLRRFSEGITKVTSDIQTMQNDVTSLQNRLEHSKHIEGHVSAILTKAAIPPSIISELETSEINEKYLKCLGSISRSSTVINSHPGTAVAHELRPCLDNIALMVSGKIRTFLLEKVQQLARPMTNISIIRGASRTTGMMKYKGLMSYLLLNNPVVAQEVKDSYVSTLSQVYHKRSKSFLTCLMKLEKQFITSKDLLTTSPKRSDDAVGMFRFTAGRTNVLERLNEPIVIPFTSIEKGRTYAYEDLFRSQHVMLMDVVTSEYIFSYDFFSDPGLYIPIFLKVITAFRDTVHAAVPQQHDYLTLMTCIRLVTQFRATMEERKIPCLTGYYEAILMMLWSQLTTVIKSNTVAVAEVSKSGSLLKGATASTVLPVIQRYAAFSGNLLHMFCSNSHYEGLADINPHTEHGDRVAVLSSQLSTVLVEILRLLNAKSHLSHRKAHLFSAHNLHHIKAVWEFYSVDPSHVDFVLVENALTQSKSNLIEALIEEYFPRFVGTITTAERGMRTVVTTKTNEEKDVGAEEQEEGGLVVQDTAEFDARRATINEAAITKCIEDFGTRWHHQLPAAFNEFYCPQVPALSADLASRLVMQVAIYNERLKKIATGCWPNPPCRRYFVGNQALLASAQSMLEGHEHSLPSA